MVATAVVRDRFAGRDMAEVMSLIFMVFMAMPIIAPGVGRYCRSPARGSRSSFMAGLIAQPHSSIAETLHPEYRRELTFKSVTGGRHRLHEPAGAVSALPACSCSAPFGFVSSSQQIFVDIFGLGALPVAFAAMAGMMAVSSFLIRASSSASACAG